MDPLEKRVISKGFVTTDLAGASSLLLLPSS